MRSVFTLLILFFGILSFTNAFAALGEKEEAIANDRLNPNNPISTPKDFKNYRVYQQKYGRGEVRQFVANGRVFGISWKGGTLPPNFSRLMAQFLPEYKKALVENKKRRLRSRQMSVKTEKFVLESFGHPPIMRGHIYIPNLLPSGVKAHDLK